MSLNTHGIKSVKYEVLYPLKKEKVRANIAPLIGSAGASVCTAHTELLERSITTAPHPLSTPQSAVRSPVRTAASFDNNSGSLLAAQRLHSDGEESGERILACKTKKNKKQKKSIMFTMVCLIKAHPCHACVRTLRFQSWRLFNDRLSSHTYCHTHAERSITTE